MGYYRDGGMPHHLIMAPLALWGAVSAGAALTNV
jgi:hypothetical protein